MRNEIIIRGIKTPLIEPEDDLVAIILDSIENMEDFGVKERDVLVISSSVISTAFGNIVKIEEVEAGGRAKEISSETGLNDKFVEIILQESDEILNFSGECILTLKDGMLRVNAGVDRSNVPAGKALLLPKNPERTAADLREKFEDRTGKEIGLIISDSHVHPLRRGTTGQVLGSSGLKEALDFREQKDLYGRRLKITFQGVGDQLASAAQLVMGEADEMIPAAIIRGAEAPFSDKPGMPLKMPPEECIYSGFFRYEDGET